MKPNEAIRERADLTISDVPTIYGCELLFDICTDDPLMSLSFEGSSPFLDWLGWQKTNICLMKKAFINFVRADKDIRGTGSDGWLSDPCADPNSFEFDTCDFTLEDFARLRRESPVRDITKTDIKYCEVQPRYRLDGTPINNDREYDMRLATEVLMQDLKRMVIEGNDSTSGQFDGLQQLVKYGYTDSDGSTCEMMDSIVIDWNDNGSDGGSGITWNGVAIASTYSLIDVLIAIVRRIKHRIRMAPALNSQKIGIGDMVLVMPEDAIPCVLDAFTCWSVCDGDQVTVNSLEARRFRDTLLGGTFGAGKIFVDGFEIPILPYDWGNISAHGSFDMWVLTGAIGNMKILHGQFNDLTIAASLRGDKFSATDGGRILTWPEGDHTCEKNIVEMQPRLVLWAPWAQARIQDVACLGPGGIISSDPWSTYFPY